LQIQTNVTILCMEMTAVSFRKPGQRFFSTVMRSDTKVSSD